MTSTPRSSASGEGLAFAMAEALLGSLEAESHGAQAPAPGAAKLSAAAPTFTPVDFGAPSYIHEDGDDTELFEASEAAEAISYILATFEPHVGEHAASAALEATDWEPMRAEALLNDVVYGAETEVPLCKFHLAGQCRRTDCAFSHDLRSVTCRFWLRGSCTNGPGCAFRHGLPNPPRDSVAAPPPGFAPTTAPIGNPRLDSNDDFPDLWGPGRPTKASAAKAQQPTPQPLSRQRAEHDDPSGPLRRTAQAFLAPPREPEVPKDPNVELFEELFGSDAPKSSAANGGWARTVQNGSGPVRRGVHGASSTKTPGRRRRNVAGGRGILETLWVETGVGVGQTYAQCRAEAARLAVERNKLFARATAAFQEGRKNDAKNWGREGRALDERMRAASQAAASRIFRQRNSATALGKGTVDLHGLHRDEAAEALEQILPGLRDDGLDSAVILVGAGHHTGGPQKGQARLRPAVEACFRDWDVSYGGLADGGGHVGALRVDLASVSW